jgi:hypothetical protein
MFEGFLEKKKKLITIPDFDRKDEKKNASYGCFCCHITNYLRNTFYQTNGKKKDVK